MDEKEYTKLLEEGKLYIYKEKHDEWADFVKKIAPEYIKISLETIKIINNESVNNGLVYFNNKKTELSTDAYAMIAFIITRFSKKGPEFYTRLRGRDITEEEKRIVEKFDEENAVHFQ